MLSLLSFIYLSTIFLKAAGPVCHLSSTVVSLTEDGFLDMSLERNRFRLSEMPQVFKKEVIREAYDKCTKHDLDHGTECLDLVKRFTDADVKLVEGDANRLWKVTHKKDIMTAAHAVQG